MDNRRKRLLFQAQHRGMKEMDLIFGRFAERHLAELTEDRVDQFEVLLNCPDQALYAWISGREPVPDEFDNEMMALIRSFEFSSQ